MEKEFFGNGKVDPLNILLKQSSLYFLYFLRLSLAFLEDEMVEPSLQKLWEVHPQRLRASLQTKEGTIQYDYLSIMYILTSLIHLIVTWTRIL